MTARKLLLSMLLCMPGIFGWAAEPPVGADGALDLDSLKGNVVVLDFWASWCVPCRRSFPWLNSMQARYADDGLIIIGVNLDNEKPAADAFLEEFPPDFRIHFDASRELAEHYGVMAMPSSYVIGRDGQVFRRHLGFKVKKQAEYEAAIAAALGAEGGVE